MLGRILRRTGRSACATPLRYALALLRCATPLRYSAVLRPHRQECVCDSAVLRPHRQECLCDSAVLLALLLGLRYWGWAPRAFRKWPTVAPVSLPFSNSGWPFTIVKSTPSDSCAGFVKLARSIIFAGSKMVMSAK